MKLTKGDIFPIAQEYFFHVRFYAKRVFGEGVKFPQTIKAEYTGEFREPKNGEWFLSGAIAEAYHSPNDLSTKYHIAKLVIVEEVKTYKKIKEF